MRGQPIQTMLVFIGLLFHQQVSDAQTVGSQDREDKQVRVLFIGNSYTGRHDLVELVEALAEAAHPELEFSPTSVIYGGRTLADHWEMKTQNIVESHSLSAVRQQTSVEEFKTALKTDPNNRNLNNALKRHQQMLRQLNRNSFPKQKWDWIVLQSYRDDRAGADSLYAQYVRKFAQIAKQQNARVLLYETTPETQNAQPLSDSPAQDPILKKAREIAALADEIGAAAAPMSLVAYRCQIERPDLTLRFVNDGHLNQTMAYLTACTIYAAIFDRSPEGLPLNKVTDIRFLDNDLKSGKDRDGNPITKTFSEQDRADLQRIAWEGYQEFQNLRQAKGDSKLP